MPGCRQIISAILLLQAQQAVATTHRLQLHNGDVLTGELRTATETTLSVYLPYAGLITLNRRDILTITQLAANESTAQPQTDNPQQHLPVMPITKAPAAIAAKPWSVELDISASNRHGQQNSSVYNLTLAADYKHQHWRTTFDSHFDYELKDKARKTHRYDVSPGLDYFISPRLFWRGSVDYQYNYLASDYRNLDFGTGPGYAVIQQPKFTLDLVAAVGIKKAYFREDGEVARFLLFGDQLNYQFGSLEWDLKYQLPVSPLELYSDGTWLHLLNQPLEFLYFDREITANVGVRYKLSDKIRLSWSYQYNQTDIELRLPGISSYSLDIKDFRQKLSLGASF